MIVDIEQGNSPFSISKAAKKGLDTLAIVSNEKKITYKELERLVNLKKSQLKLVKPYPVVAMQSLETLVLLFTLLEVQCPILLLHPSLTQREREELLKDINSVQEELPKDAAVILFTSGTTGRPKPAVLTYQSLYASASSCSNNIPLKKGDIWQLSISPARIGGFSILIRCLLANATVSISPKFKVEELVSKINDEEVTYASIVPTMLQMIMDRYPDWSPPRTLKALLIGGAPCPSRLKKWAKKQRIPLVLTYGMTETASNVVTTAFKNRFGLGEGTGRPNPRAEVKIVEDRILVKGPMLFWGYWGKGAIGSGSWFDTGDIGEMAPDGTIFVHARRTDMIISGGENVYPTEVEEVLEEMPSISQALVCGCPDEIWGSIVTALLVVKSGCLKPSVDQIKEFLKNKLAKYKSPRRVAFVNEIPVLPSGKPNRNASVLKGLRFESIHYTR